MALSSSAIGWTRVSVWHRTSTGRFPLPTKLRMISMQWQPRSMIAPPPVSRPSQNHALCGPGCVSRERTQVTSPTAPPRDGCDRLERLRRVAQVLEIAGEDARVLDHRQHPPRFLGRPPERLRAQDRLAGLRREPDGLLVQEVRQADRRRRRCRDARSRRPGRSSIPRSSQRSRKAGAARLAARVDDADAVATALAVEGVRVEVADQPGPEHRDRVAVHACSSVVGASGRARVRGRGRGPRRAHRSLAGRRPRAVWLKPQSGTRPRRSAGTPVLSTGRSARRRRPASRDTSS